MFKIAIELIGRLLADEISSINVQNIRIDLGITEHLEDTAQKDRRTYL